MDARRLVFVLLLSVVGLSLSWANPLEVRTAESMIKVGNYARKGRWFGIIREARRLYRWGEVRYVDKCLELAGRLVVAKRSEAGAMHVADLYGKIRKPQKKKYWMDFLKYLKKLKARRWRKS